MFLKLLYSVLFSLLALSNGYLKNENELKRQYSNYRQIHNKEETPYGYNLFLKNLQKVEIFNANNVDCRMYLTQYSDTYDEQSTVTKCFVKR
jgi:hypothetical protein